jgi:hypothetical protein
MSKTLELQSGMDQREQFETAYYYFYHSLKILAHSPHEQCRQQGNYNTAWELKYDVSREGAFIENHSNLADDQRQGLVTLLAALEDVPATELPAGVEFKDTIGAD